MKEELKDQFDFHMTITCPNCGSEETHYIELEKEDVNWIATRYKENFLQGVEYIIREENWQHRDYCDLCYEDLTPAQLERINYDG
jgi:RNase P subunit RPR2